MPSSRRLVALVLLTAWSSTTACYVAHATELARLGPSARIRIESAAGLSMQATSAASGVTTSRCAARRIEGTVRSVSGDTLWLDRVFVQAERTGQVRCASGLSYLVIPAAHPDARIERVELSPGRTLALVVLSIPAVIAVALLVACTSPDGCF